MVFCCLDLVVVWLSWGRETVFDLGLHWLSWTEFPVNFFVEDFEAWGNIWLGQGFQFELMHRNQKLGYTQRSSKLAKFVTLMIFIKELHQFYRRIMYFTETVFFKKKQKTKKKTLNLKLTTFKGHVS